MTYRYYYIEIENEKYLTRTNIITQSTEILIPDILQWVNQNEILEAQKQNYKQEKTNKIKYIKEEITSIENELKAFKKALLLNDNDAKKIV